MKRMRSITALTATLIGLGALAMVAGCSKEGNEWQRLVVEVAQINDGAPVISSYLTGTENLPQCDGTDLLPIDIIPVEFVARPYNSAVVLQPGEPFSTFEITSYDVIWHPMSAVADSLTAHNILGAATSLRVTLDEPASVNVLIADRGLKDQPWFVAALSPCVGGNVGTFRANAELRFHGHETGTERDVVIPAPVTVDFVGYIKQQ